MRKKNKKYLQIFSIITSLGLLNTGCTQWENFSTGKTKRIGTLEEQVLVLSDSVENLNDKNTDLMKTIHESQLQKQKKEPLFDEYSQLKNRLTEIEAVQKLQNNNNYQLKEELIKTRNQLQEIEQKLISVETDRANIKTQIEELESAYVSLSTNEPQLTEMKDITVKTEDTFEKEPEEVMEESRESVIKNTQKKLEASLIEDLLDKAINLYRQEEFEEAIAKWQEVLSLNPNIHEAKFNIEIAHDKIKEKKIQEGLKSNLIQRK